MYGRLALLLALAACDTQVAGGKADGAAVYAEACARCHGPGGQPTETMKAQLDVRDLTGDDFRARASKELVEAQVRRGSPNGVMPRFEGALTDAQIAAVADYVMSLARP